MIYDFNDYNFHVWLVLLITVALIGLNLIVPKVRLNKINKLKKLKKIRKKSSLRSFIYIWLFIVGNRFSFDSTKSEHQPLLLPFRFACI